MNFNDVGTGMNDVSDIFDVQQSLSSFLEVNLDTNSSALPSYVNNHVQPEDKFPCLECNKKIINNNEELICRNCKNKSQSSKNKVQSDIPKKRGRPKKIVADTDNADSSKNLACEQCLKTFKTKNQLKLHSAVHADKSFSCTVCEKSFKLKQQLKNHCKIHEDNKPYVCTVCEKQFKLKQQLENHSKTHSDIRPYECPYCERAFKFKQQLQIHSRVHDDVRPFKCEHCSKAFKLKQQLQFHERVHSDLRPFSCQLCDKSFKFKQQLQIHDKVHSVNNSNHFVFVNNMSKDCEEAPSKEETIEENNFSELVQGYTMKEESYLEHYNFYPVNNCTENFEDITIREESC